MAAWYEGLLWPPANEKPFGQKGREFTGPYVDRQHLGRPSDTIFQFKNESSQTYTPSFEVELILLTLTFPQRQFPLSLHSMLS